MTVQECKATNLTPELIKNIWAWVWKDHYEPLYAVQQMELLYVLAYSLPIHFNLCSKLTWLFVYVIERQRERFYVDMIGHTNIRAKLAVICTTHSQTIGL